MIDVKKLTYIELRNLRAVVVREMDLREAEPPIGYKCPCCNFVSTHSIDVSDHLKEAHRYPNEDALYSVQKIYRYNIQGSSNWQDI